MGNKFEQALELVDQLMREKDGEEVLAIAGMVRPLLETNEDILNRKELLTMAERIYEASGMSDWPLLMAERTEAVKTMMAYGISRARCPELPNMSPAEATELLLNCSVSEFSYLVDVVALDNQEFYAPDITQHDMDALIQQVSKMIWESKIDTRLKRALAEQEDELVVFLDLVNDGFCLDCIDCSYERYGYIKGFMEEHGLLEYDKNLEEKIAEANQIGNGIPDKDDKCAAKNAIGRDF